MSSQTYTQTHTCVCVYFMGHL